MRVRARQDSPGASWQRFRRWRIRETAVSLKGRQAKNARADEKNQHRQRAAPPSSRIHPRAALRPVTVLPSSMGAALRSRRTGVVLALRFIRD
jgi:hypothetical protein